ncbi:MAG: pantoate--beta-alanine ligase [Planctomycetes bacterium]|nr:pantoate--beta-alanine ligase [Planctomycetota bacterium]
MTTAQALRALVTDARRTGRTIGLVPTMGALHAGHISLVAESCRRCDVTIATIFVNPTQFGPNEDFSKYPRTLEADLQLLAPHNVAAVFAPASVQELYSPHHATSVKVAGAALPLEGERRPGHFDGVATIVLKLFNLAQPDVAFFGAKDFQQVLVIKQMVRDLNVPVEVAVCPIVREADGLAMSSRNAYLSAEQRRQALVLSRSLQRGVELVAGGERDAARLLASMQSVIASEPAVQLDYLVLVDPDTLSPVAQVTGPTLAAIAAKVGNTRLIDNIVLRSD